MTAHNAPTLLEYAWPLSENRSENIWLSASLRFVTMALLGSAILALSAKFRLHVGPVPLSMQTFALLSFAMLAGWRLAAAAVLAWLAQGAVGLPVFAGTPEKGIGIAYMMGPTGGYLAGFLLAAIVVGMLAERGWDRSIFLAGIAMLAGNVLIYVPGLLWLGMLIGWDKPVLELGLLPFLAGDAIKIALAMALFPAIWSLIRRF